MIIKLFELKLRLEGSFNDKDKQARLNKIKSKLGRESDFALQTDTESTDNQATLYVMLMAPHAAKADQRQSWFETLLKEGLDGEILSFRVTEL